MLRRIPSEQNTIRETSSPYSQGTTRASAAELVMYLCEKKTAQVSFNGLSSDSLLKVKNTNWIWG